MKKFSCSYAPELGVYGDGDFYLPDDRAGAVPIVLLIHGGGWVALDKSSCTGIAEFLCENNFAVFSINYRLCRTSPWPACAVDCLKAADFLLSGGGLPAGTLDIDRLIVCGGSAGGHLALYTALKLGSPTVKKVVAISPIADPVPDYKMNPERYDTLFGCRTTEQLLQEIAPLQFAAENMPEILITHANTDNVVPQESSGNFIAAVQQKYNIAVKHFYYEGIGTGHRIWIPESSPHRLLPEIEAAVKRFLSE